MSPIPLIDKIVTEIIGPAMWFIFVLGFLFFLYGVFEVVRDSDSDEARTKGRQHILWGLVGIFIMLSFWGIMNVICRTISADCGL